MGFSTHKSVANRLDALGVVVALLAVALWMDFSRLQRHQNGDSLVMSLISLYRWTPLFWEQDRLGMLVPALAIPFRTPLANMLAQAGLTIFSGLAGFFLLGYYVAGRRRGMTIGAVGALLFVLLVNEWRRFGYFVYIHQFATSLSLSLAALLLLEQWRRRGGQRPREGFRSAVWRLGAARPGVWRLVVALVLIWLAMWVNPAAAFALGPLILARRALKSDLAWEFDHQDGFVRPADVAVNGAGGVPPGERRRLGLSSSDWFTLAALGSGLAASVLISRLAAAEHQEYRFLGPRAWADCALGLARDLPGQLGTRWFWAVVAVGASGLTTLVRPAGRRAVAASGRVALVLIAAAAIQYAFVSSLEHVHRTDFGHYAFTSVFLWQGALVAFCVLQWAAVTPGDGRFSRRAPWVLLGLFVIAAAARHGRPGLDVVRRSVAEGIGRFTPEVLASRSTHVTGGYTDVWVTVFHANMLLADEGSPYTVWGIATRAAPTADRWTAVPLAETRIAVLGGQEQEARAMLARYGIPPLILERELTTIRVMRPAESLAASRVAEGLR